MQTYAGPIEIYGDKLMLCIVHDITEQKRLEEQLEHAAHHDAMTGLLNRRQFYHITEPGQMQHLAIAQDYSLLLIDTDRFKHINDLYGHSKGDEVLCASPAPSKVALAKAICVSLGRRRVCLIATKNPTGYRAFAG